MKLGEPLAERKKIINKLLKSPQSSHTLNFRFQHFELPVIGLPIELLKYRIENGREYWDIKEFEEQNKLTEGYFLDNKEDLKIQEQMHDWLYERAIRGEEDLRKEYDKPGATQMHPIIINNRTDGFVGFVVDGNRRLSLWRQMYDLDPNKYSSFKIIQCAVLPASFDAEMEEKIEMDLQIKKSLKADYDWPNDRRLKQKAIGQYEDPKMGVKIVADEYNITEGRLKQELAGYDLAKEYKEETGALMSSLLDDMQAFLTLGQAYAKGGRTPYQKKELKHLAFEIIRQEHPKPAKHNQIQTLDQNLVKTVLTINKNEKVPEKTEIKKQKKGKLKPKGRGEEEGPPSNITGRPIGELTDVTKEAIKEINRLKALDFEAGKPLENIKRWKSTLQSFLDESIKGKIKNKKDIKIQVEEIKKILKKIEKKLNSKS